MKGDIAHGRRGGHTLPARTPAEERMAFAAAVAAGQVVLVRCACTWSWSTPAGLAQPEVDRMCTHCHWPYYEATPAERAAMSEREAA